MSGAVDDLYYHPRDEAPRGPGAADAPLDRRFTELFDEHYPRLVVFFGRRHVDAELSRDLAQETMIRVLNGLAGFRGEVPARSWILRIATDVWRNWLRDHRWTQKRSAVEDSLETAYEEREPAETSALWPRPADDPEGRLAEAEERTTVYARIDELSALQRRCLSLWLDGMSYQEIAETVGTSLQTVRPTLHKAKSRLRALLTAGPGLDPPRPEDRERDDR